HPHSDTAPPLTDFCDLVDPRHAWMNVCQISKSENGVRSVFLWKTDLTPIGMSSRSQKSVEGGVGPVAGA
ncbi:hypothetical protein, partial [Stenotrophomonas maltophilia]|uniref:hypothetical protein n=1 Tax=Stenotrophomonas maltophilia TaxID=40324 RepID=UPI001B7D77E5